MAPLLLAMSFSIGLPPACLAQLPPAEQQVAETRSGLSMDQAVKMAERRFKARVVRAEAQEEAGRKIYVLRMLNDSGRVWTVRVDAATGEVL